MNDDDLRHIVGRHSAFEALVWAIARTHPDRAAMVSAFKENSEIIKAHLLNLPLSDVYLDAFEKARAQILSRMGVSE